MTIEFVGFYPLISPIKIKKATLIGTAHVFLVEERIDIRGIGVIKKNNNIWYSMPFKRDIDPETKKSIRYPVISFLDKDKQDQIIDCLKKACPKAMQEALEHTKKTRTQDKRKSFLTKIT